MLHLGFAWIAELLPPIELSYKQDQEPVEISLVERETQRPIKDIVPAIVPMNEVEKNTNTPANHYSSATHRVKEETVAPPTGRQATLNEMLNQKLQIERAQQQSPPKDLHNPAPKTDQQVRNETEGITEKKRDALEDFQRPLSIQNQGSYIGVGKHGSFTALNTDWYHNYSFFSRVEQATRFRWETNLDNAIMQLMRNPQQPSLGNSLWVTRVEFLLDREGNIRKILVLKSSGIIPFDIAATQAFKDAATFPNPPKEMVEGDGMIHLEYQFRVNYNPAWAARNQ